MPVLVYCRAVKTCIVLATIPLEQLSFAGLGSSKDGFSIPPHLDLDLTLTSLCSHLALILLRDSTVYSEYDNVQFRRQIHGHELLDIAVTRGPLYQAI